MTEGDGPALPGSIELAWDCATSRPEAHDPD
jgi:hypothetical protein